MVKIRLRRTGSKKRPTYRVIIADSRSPRDGRFIEIIGNYNPRTNPITVNIHEDRAKHWLSVGAQPTEAVHRLLQKVGVLDKTAVFGTSTDAPVATETAEISLEKSTVEESTNI